MPKALTMDDMWRNYRATVVHKDATVNQLQQLEIAFKAGAISVLHLFTQHIPDLPESVGCQIINSLLKETRALEAKMLIIALSQMVPEKKNPIVDDNDNAKKKPN